MTLKNGSLFSGIGGFELGARMSGIQTLWNCEIKPFNRDVLSKNFPNTNQYHDILTLENPPYCDIISGGFPCQDISLANYANAQGIRGKRSGLWSEMHRIICSVRPNYVIIENSPALLFRGFEQVLCDLSRSGYDAEWQVLSAKAFGYKHKRRRLFVIAYANRIGRATKDVQTSIFSLPIQKKWGGEFGRAISGALQSENHSGILRDDDGFPFVVDRIAGCGNAVVPGIAHYLFECIKAHDLQITQLKINE